jgi:hypothetical protein
VIQPIYNAKSSVSDDSLSTGFHKKYAPCFVTDKCGGENICDQQRDV